MAFYKDCRYIPIWNFNMINIANDLRFLVVGFDESNDETEPKKSDLKGADEHWIALLDEWVALVDDTRINMIYDLSSELNYLKIREQVSLMILEQIYTREMDEETFGMYIKSLREWEYYWNSDESLIDNLHRITREIRADRNKIGLKESEYDNLKSKEGVSQTLEKQSVIVEQVLGKNHIDLKTTSVTRWIELVKLSEEINKDRKNGK